ncbi:MAG: CbiX/SirB N-terminal domain-containing protein [Gemmataceae bacterium]
MATALLLIAHGSRQPEANADLHRVADQIRTAGHYAIVVPSYLELAEPTIEAGGSQCVEAGASRVVMVPYFLAAGVHVRRDLAAARDALDAAFPMVSFQLAEPLGPHPLLTRIVLERAGQV